MNEVFELVDSRNAQNFLKSFAGEYKGRGEALFRNGRVENLAPTRPGLAYTAQVSDGKRYDIVLQYEALDGWQGTCSCPEEVGCEHVFAAMRALLAEHSTASVRSLSSGA